MCSQKNQIGVKKMSKKQIDEKKYDLENIAGRIQFILDNFYYGSPSFMCEEVGLQYPRFYTLKQGLGFLSEDVAEKITQDTGISKEWIIDGTGPMEAEGRALIPRASSSKEEVGKRLEKISKKLFQSPSQFSRILGHTASVRLRWFSGVTKPQKRNMQKLVELTGVDAGWILGGGPEPDWEKLKNVVKSNIKRLEGSKKSDGHLENHPEDTFLLETEDKSNELSNKETFVAVSASSEKDTVNQAQTKIEEVSISENIHSESEKLSKTKSTKSDLLLEISKKIVEQNKLQCEILTLLHELNTLVQQDN